MDTHKLRITVSNMKNANTVAQLQSMRDTVLQNLSQLPPAPSVPFTRPPPKFQVVSPSSTSVQCLRPRLLGKCLGSAASEWRHQSGLQTQPSCLPC